MKVMILPQNLGHKFQFLVLVEIELYETSLYILPPINVGRLVHGHFETCQNWGRLDSN